MEIRFDGRERETHIADGDRYLCDRLRDPYRSPGALKQKVTPTRQGELRDVECPHCWNVFAELEKTKAS
jgi:hypothetical protein